MDDQIKSECKKQAARGPAVYVFQSDVDPDTLLEKLPPGVTLYQLGPKDAVVEILSEGDYGVIEVGILDIISDCAREV